MRILQLILDGLPTRHVSHRTTPHLAALARTGGWSPAGGLSVLVSSTYPNMATLATGAEPFVHGLTANHVATAGGIRPAWEIGPAVPTLLETAAEAGLATAAAFGDHHLVSVLGAGHADTHWPPRGTLPAGCATTDYGYAADAEAVGHIVAAVDGPADLVVGQLNGADTAAHVHGPDSESALAAFREADRCLGDVLAEARRRWLDTVVVVTSDHDQEPAGPHAPVDLAAHATAAGVEVTVVDEGSGAVLTGPGSRQAELRWLRGVPGVAGSRPVGRGRGRVVWAQPGHRFGPAGSDGPAGQHGGISTRTQVAVVGGGHPVVPALAAAVGRTRPRAADWAVTLAQLLGLRLPHSTGASLLARTAA